MADDANKSEKATPHKLREAKEKGQAGKSIEVSGSLMMLFFGITLLMVGNAIWTGLEELMSMLLLNSAHTNITKISVLSIMFDVFFNVASLFAPIILVLILSALIFNIAQTGPILSSHPITPDWKKLNPVQGAKKIFSIKTLFDFFKALLKVAVITFVWIVFGQDWLNTVMDSYGMSVGAFQQHWVNSSVAIFILLVVLMLPMALIDFAFSKWDFAKKMRMSKQDVKDEYKKKEGDPLVKQKQKQIQKELLQKAASLNNVKDADVIITNPEHIAVALKYVPKDMLAPKILAMGEDNNAAAIRKIARTHNVPIVRNIPLARAIYKNSILDGFIPEDCYQSVASIFRDVLGMHQSRQGSNT